MKLLQLQNFLKVCQVTLNINWSVLLSLAFLSLNSVLNWHRITQKINYRLKNKQKTSQKLIFQYSK